MRPGLSASRILDKDKAGAHVTLLLLSFPVPTALYSVLRTFHKVCGSRWRRKTTFFSSLFPVLRQVQLIRHSINHGRCHVGMVQKPLDAPKIAPRALQLLHGISLTQGMHAHVLGHSERLCGPFHVCPDRLPSPVLPRVPNARKSPFRASLCPDVVHQSLRQVHPPPLPRLGLPNPELPPQLFGLEGQHVTNPQARMHSDPAHQPISRCQGRKDVLHLTLKKILGRQTRDRRSSRSTQLSAVR